MNGVSRAIVIAALLLGCTKGKAHAPQGVAPADVIRAMTAFRERVCACGAEGHDEAQTLQCLHDLRDQYDAQKAQLVPNDRFTPADTSALAAQRQQLALCGDAGGLTFWK